MKKVVITFGIIGGLVSSVLMLGTIPFENQIGYDRALIVGYTTMVASFLMVLDGPDEVVAIVRQMMGATNPAQAAPGTIRGDLAPGYDATENLIHGSDSDESAGREITLFFPLL